VSAPSPTVVGPIAGARPPWGAPRVDVAARGYVVEEFHLEGTLAGHQLRAGTDADVDGRWEVEPYGDAPYRTRILVMRPDRAERFNGTVVVNWQNVSAGIEAGAPKDGEIFEGHAWVGVSAQEVGLYGFPPGMDRFGGRRAEPLLAHDPERYGTLHHPCDQGAFDIFAQAGLAVGPDRSPGVDPMGGLDVRRVIATGGSQSAMRLVTYVNAFHRDAGVFDAFLLSVWEGRAPRPEEGAVALGVRTSIRDDLTTPIVVVNSEFETHHLIGLPLTDSDHLRIWEVAGAPHGVARNHDAPPDARGRVVNPLSIWPVYDAALRGVHHWLASGRPVPTQPRIAVDDQGASGIRRDDDGNAIGGIRLPELEAPTHEYRGVAFGTGRPPLFGAARPFSDDELRARYPSRAAYVAQWCTAVDALVTSGALRPEDAPAMKARADDVALPVT
jgi:Alpha/beta hydrolase domain